MLDQTGPGPHSLGDSYWFDSRDTPENGRPLLYTILSMANEVTSQRYFSLKCVLGTPLEHADNVSCNTNMTYDIIKQYNSLL